MTRRAPCPKVLEFDRSRLEGAPCRSGAKQPSQPAGFSLIVVLMWVVLLGLVSLLLQLRLTDQLETLPAGERRLYSLVMAQNGLEFARAALPGLDVNRLLIGPDGVHAGVTRPEWRNPLPWSLARSEDPESHSLSPDDGLLFDSAAGALDRAYGGANGGYFFLRFSNNPEEPPEQDRDGVVIVRSLGVARSRLPALSLGGVIHSTALAEARLRQERVFDLGSAVTLYANRGEFNWDGQDFQVQGGTECAVSLIQDGPGSLETDLDASLTPEQRTRIGGGGASPWADQTAAWRESVQGRRIFEPRFWEHFVEQLPRFSEPAIPGLRYLPDGGELTESFAGILAARGSLRLSGNAHIRGLLLHLGSGRLELRDAARVEGGLWMGSAAGGESGALEPVQLRVGDRARIVHDPEAVRRALQLFPPTQLGWRLLFPEMVL